MKRPPQKLSWVDTVYGVTYTLLVCPRADLAAWFKKHVGPVPDGLDEGTPDATTFVYTHLGHHVVFWFHPSPTPGGNENAALVAHEAFHATTAVLKTASVTLADASEEAWAYYLQYVFGNLLARLRKVPVWRKALNVTAVSDYGQRLERNGPWPT